MSTKMRTIYQIDSFSTQIFKGNPAAVMILEEWLPDLIMQNIALENNLSETAFVVKEKGEWYIRWFTPLSEVDLCGHATLAAAHVIMSEEYLANDSIQFQSRSGILKVRKSLDQYIMNFPSDPPQQSNIKWDIEKGTGYKSSIFLKGKDDFLVVLENEDQIKNLKPDFQLIADLPGRGLIVSAPGNESDFVSRCFFPQTGVPEDPVTGSAHCTLACYWSGRLGKNILEAVQLSPRSGKLKVEFKDNRVFLYGSAVTFMKGIVRLL